jgi:hypothetical protein
LFPFIPEGWARIARRFNAGTRNSSIALVPKGRLNGLHGIVSATGRLEIHSVPIPATVGTVFATCVSTRDPPDGLGGRYNTTCNAVMAPDGWWVAFQSRATPLSASDTNVNSDIYLRDMRAGTTMLVSATLLGTTDLVTIFP